jgi:hypothetical protein
MGASFSAEQTNLPIVADSERAGMVKPVSADIKVNVIATPPPVVANSATNSAGPTAAGTAAVGTAAVGTAAGTAAGTADPLAQSAADRLAADLRTVEQAGGAKKSKAKASKPKATSKGKSKSAAKSADKPKSRGTGLEKKTIDKLIERARKLDIKGRSSMDKKELVKAIRDKNNGKKK